MLSWHGSIIASKLLIYIHRWSSLITGSTSPVYALAGVSYFGYPNDPSSFIREVSVLTPRYWPVLVAECLKWNQYQRWEFLDGCCLNWMLSVNSFISGELSSIIVGDFGIDGLWNHVEEGLLKNSFKYSLYASTELRP